MLHIFIYKRLTSPVQFFLLTVGVYVFLVSVRDDLIYINIVRLFHVNEWSGS